MTNLKDVAQEIKEKYLNNEQIDFGADMPRHVEHVKPDPSVILHEHEGEPRSYMVFNNLKNIIMDASELLSIMNENDDLPAWTQELISNGKNAIAKALDYVRAEKSED